MPLPAQVTRDRKIGKRPVTLPHLEVKQSLVPFGGLGVFAQEDLPRGAWVTEYGGEVIDYELASQRRANGQDTHIRSLGIGRGAVCLDSRIRGERLLSCACLHVLIRGSGLRSLIELQYCAAACFLCSSRMHVLLFCFPGYALQQASGVFDY